MTGRVVVSCSGSTVRFVGGFLVWSFVAVVLVRVLVNLGLGFRRRSENFKVEVIKRRDRSLGGKEVVVERRVKGNSDVGVNAQDLKEMPRRTSNRREQKKLPNWWPDIGPRPVIKAFKEEYRRQANLLVQGLYFEDSANFYCFASVLCID